MSFADYVLTAIIPLNLILGFLVMLRGYHVRSTQFFGTSIFFICLWAIGDLMLRQAKSVPVVHLGYLLFYVGPMFTTLFLVYFALSFKAELKRIHHILMRLFAFITLGLGLVITVKSNFLVNNIVINHHVANTPIVTKGGWLLYMLFFSTLFITTYLLLFIRIRNVSALARTQVQYVLGGIILTSGSAYVTNLLMPLLGDTTLIWMGPASTIFYVSITVLAIIKHRLFDIRLVVARTLAYVGSITLLATVYGLIVFTIARYIFGLNISVVAQIVLSAATGIAGLIFQKLLKLFDKATNSFFYQDAYDAQELFDRLNRVLVSSLDLTYLMKHSSTLLSDSLKAEFVIMGLKGDNEHDYRMAGTDKVSFKIADIEKVRAITPKFHQSVIVTDYLDDKHRNLKQVLSSNNIAVIVRLAPDVSQNAEGLGYIVLGAKKSGNPYSSQDIRVLDTVANELIIAIQNALHFDEIQKFNVTLQHRVEEATRKLRRTNARLEALDETKDDFISMASHQLRTPLTSVKGYISMVLDGDAGNISTAQRKMLSQAFISSQRMVFLIADLLNVSRLKTGKFVIEPSPVNLAKLVAEEVAPLVETAQARGITLTYAKPKSFPTLNLDETKTRQVIMNFVDNAIYYTRPGGHIDVQLVDKPATIELKVVDNGIGVPTAEQHHLFTKFYRARNAQRARPDGTGLGLFMAKKVILGQGGAILFDSREGKGSTFGFTFAKSRLQIDENPVDNLPASVKKPSESTKKALQKA